MTALCYQMTSPNRCRIARVKKRRKNINACRITSASVSKPARSKHLFERKVEVTLPTLILWVFQMFTLHKQRAKSPSEEDSQVNYVHELKPKIPYVFELFICRESLLFEVVFLSAVQKSRKYFCLWCCICENDRRCGRSTTTKNEAVIDIRADTQCLMFPGRWKQPIVSCDMKPHCARDL